MSLQSRPLRLTDWLLAGAFACVLGLGSAPTQAEPIVIVNAANASSLDEEYAAKIFLRQVKVFPDGSPAQPVNQKDGPLTDDFRQKVLKKNGAQFKSYWAQQLFTGAAKPVPEVDGDEAVLKQVADTPGGIGYIDSSKLKPGVKAMRR